MTLVSRLAALENLLGAEVLRCPKCDGPGGRGVVILEEGQELHYCPECEGPMDDGRPVGLVLADGDVWVQTVTLHDGPAPKA